MLNGITNGENAATLTDLIENPTERFPGYDVSGGSLQTPHGMYAPKTALETVSGTRGC